MEGLSTNRDTKPFREIPSRMMTDDELKRYCCPVCGGGVGEEDKFFHCTNFRFKDGNCQYKIWKRLFDVMLTKKELHELLSIGKTREPVYGFTDRRKGKMVSHKLYYNQKMNMVRFLYDDSYDDRKANGHYATKNHTQTVKGAEK